ncbi:hypothetical protein PVAP13_3NG003880 [Panicum virgatum]|uniref:Uncharacterized protein n=1 Tax=Panicum virgatum TaxID=38727 RepID=A0A8T0U1G9_PANVG|nr:hypothetical protein PVAP13_3NG003880 [Panicum virgatum]
MPLRTFLHKGDTRENDGRNLRGDNRAHWARVHPVGSQNDAAASASRFPPDTPPPPSPTPSDRPPPRHLRHRPSCTGPPLLPPLLLYRRRSPPASTRAAAHWDLRISPPPRVPPLPPSCGASRAETRGGAPARPRPLVPGAVRSPTGAAPPPRPGESRIRAATTWNRPAAPSQVRTPPFPVFSGRPTQLHNRFSSRRLVQPGLYTRKSLPSQQFLAPPTVPRAFLSSGAEGSRSPARPQARMCGIFAYLNYNVSRERRYILEVLFNDLRRLEYRGVGDHHRAYRRLP